MTNLPPDIEDRLVCPGCHSSLDAGPKVLRCLACGSVYPVIDGVPVLLVTEASVFTPDGAQRLDEYVFSRVDRGRVITYLRRLLPASATNLYAEGALATMARLLADGGAGRPGVLLLGAGDGGAGLDVVLGAAWLDCVRTDVVLGPDVSVVLDAHDIPFAPETFDAVIVQAVLEHVLDPARCVQEIWRVLKPQALVYAETPFMQQVHGGRYDFTRYTFLGHRRLLRQFSELDSGIVAGPGAALAWAWEYFLMSFCRSARGRQVARTFGRATSFHLKYCDRVLVGRPGSYDAASAFGFLGRKAPAGAEMADQALLDSYPGMIR